MTRTPTPSKTPALLFVSTLRDPKPAAPGPPPFEMLCPRCGVSRWVTAAACDRYEADGWPRCCGRTVSCFVFGRRESSGHEAAK